MPGGNSSGYSRYHDPPTGAIISGTGPIHNNKTDLFI